MRDATTDGLLLVDKAAGMTSHDVVLAARRAVGESRIGHAGTLDPFATGLLVLLVGRATRLLPYLDGEPKVYDATIAFGRETDTDDLHGATTRETDAPADDVISAAVGRLTGALEQVPPAYSAKRVAGRRAYHAARAGVALELPPVAVDIHEWRDVTREGNLLRATIECGGGTYIRALARDLGRLTGSAAHLAALRRVRSGAFRVEDAIDVDALRAGDAMLRPTLDALPTLPRVALAASDAERVLRGIAVPRTDAAARAALVDSRSGALIALAEGIGQTWQPRVVMRKVD